MRTAREPSLLAAAGVLVFVASYALRPLDVEVGQGVVGAPGLVLAAGAMAFLGGIDFLAPAIAIVVLVLAALRRWWGALRIGLVPAVTDLATRILKLVFARPRPEWALVEGGGFSFPSGHAAGGAAFAVLLAWFATRHLRGQTFVILALSAAVAWAALMALSRLVLGVHHLSDVVAGIGTGMAVGGGVLALTVLAEREYLRRKGSP